MALSLLILAATAVGGMDAAKAPDVARPLREADWRGVRREPMVGGGEVRLLRSGRDVYVAIEGPARGYPSLCVGDAQQVEILHASAALGTVSYRHAGGSWRLQQPFAWELRDGGSTPHAQASLAAQQAAFYRHAGWLSTASRGGEPVRLFRIRIEPSRAWLGVVFLDTATLRTSFWPASMGPACRQLALVMGDAPATLEFDPTSWHGLDGS